MNAPPIIPDHTLLRPIGRGAYGEVWLARNVMGVLRAVKIVERRHFNSSRPYEREFAGIQRYEPVSRLTDGLVHVLHVGRNEAEGYFYYVMELADAVPTGEPAASNASGNKERETQKPNAEDYSPRTLRSDLKSLRRLPIADCLRIALDVVSGLARLHERGLVHRDVKPGNIIFVNGRAKLADIGLVSTHGEGRTFVGTEGYIPPEGPGSSIADLYALGMCLYEAATGRPPEEFPKVPTEWFAEEAGTESIEFHEIVLKACEGAKERRYQSAEQMQADLALLQSGQSVRHVHMLERRAARTQRFAWAAGIVVTLALATTLIANWRARIAEQMRQRESALLQEARDARAEESLARTRAEGAELAARQQLNAALFEQARAMVLSKELGHRTRALDALRRAKGATNSAEMRRVAVAAMTLPDLELKLELGFDRTTTLTQPDPNFQQIALCQGRGPVRICSLPDLDLLATLPASTNLEAFMAEWSSDARFLAVKRQHDANGQRSDYELWNLASTQRVAVVGPDVAYGSVSMHPRLPQIMTGHSRGRVKEWNLETGGLVRSFKLPNTPHALAYSPDGTRIAASFRTTNYDQWAVAFLDATNLNLVRTIDYPESIEIMAWHPGSRFLTGNALHSSEWARGVHLIDSETSALTLLGEHKIKTAFSEFVADGDYLFTGGWDREVICWDLQAMQRTFTYGGTGYRHYWSADGQQCAISLASGHLQFFDFVRPKHRNLTGMTNGVLQHGRFSRDGHWLAALTDRNMCVWDLRSTAPAAVLSVAAGSEVCFSSDSSELFVGPEGYGERINLRRWRLLPGNSLNEAPRLEALPVHSPMGLTRATLYGEQLLLTSTGGVHFVSSTNLGSGESRTVPARSGIGTVSPDGRLLAMVYDYSPNIGIFRLPGMEHVTTVQTSNYVGFVDFSPSSSEMVVINRSGIEWFDTKNWNCIRRRPGAGVSGSYAFYTPDENSIWMVTHFRNGELLDRKTLQPILPLPSNFVPLALSPDGRHLAVSVEGRRVQLWDMDALRGELGKLGLNW